VSWFPPFFSSVELYNDAIIALEASINWRNRPSDVEIRLQYWNSGITKFGFKWVSPKTLAKKGDLPVSAAFKRSTGN